MNTAWHGLAVVLTAASVLAAAPASALRDPDLDAPDVPREGPARMTCYVGLAYVHPLSVGCPAETTDATFFDNGREMRVYLETQVVTDVTAIPGNTSCYPAAFPCAADATGWTYPDEDGNFVWEHIHRGERLIYRHSVGTPLVP